MTATTRPGTLADAWRQYRERWGAIRYQHTRPHYHRNVPWLGVLCSKNAELVR